MAGPHPCKMDCGGSNPFVSSLHFLRGGVYDMRMRNKIKIVAVVAAVIIGMVLYKNHYDKHHDDDDRRDSKHRAKARAKDLPN